MSTSTTLATPCARAPRRRRAARIAGRLLATGMLAVVLAGCLPLNSQEHHLLSHVNSTRVAHGRAPLASNDALVQRARSFAAQLAREGRLRHSDLRTLRASYSKSGENVGRGSSIQSIAGAFVKSPAHRAIMLDPSFTQVGMGTARAANGTIYAVQVYGRR
jgi:uncharacterized protein YkwD